MNTTKQKVFSLMQVYVLIYIRYLLIYLRTYPPTYLYLHVAIPNYISK